MGADGEGDEGKEPITKEEAPEVAGAQHDEGDASNEEAVLDQGLGFDAQSVNETHTLPRRPRYRKPPTEWWFTDWRYVSVSRGAVIHDYSIWEWVVRVVLLVGGIVLGLWIGGHL